MTPRKRGEHDAKVAAGFAMQREAVRRMRYVYGWNVSPSLLIDAEIAMLPIRVTKSWLREY